MNIPVQIDLGNLAVGLATVFVAAVTLFISLKTLRQNDDLNRQRNRQSADIRIAEMRQLWIDDLRQHLAQFSEETFQAISLSREEKPAYHLKIVYLRSYIRLKLNTKEEKHQTLMRAISDVIEITNRFVGHQHDRSEDGKHLSDYNNALARLNTVSDEVLKEEWSRVKAEIRSSTRTNG
jgi:hypothetical protein